MQTKDIDPVCYNIETTDEEIQDDLIMGVNTFFKECGKIQFIAD